MKIFKEPLLQFLLIGAGLFFVYNILNAKKSNDEIVIDSNIINEISAKYKMQWNREPGLQELSGLIETYLEQEVLYREAKTMNLDQNDEIIKRRLAQKMEFLSDDVSGSLEPDENALRTFYETHKDYYAKPVDYSLKQIYFSNDKRRDAWNDANLALSENRTENSGDPISIPFQYINTGADKIALELGSKFASELDSLPAGKWTGPVRSGLGVHIVFIEEKKPSGFYSFEEVSDKVKVDYSFDAGNTFRKELISAMLKNYKVVIDVPEPELKEVLSEKY